MEKPIPVSVMNRIPLMEGGQPSQEVVGRMTSAGYRRKILRQMLDQRFIIGELDTNAVDLDELDKAVLSIIKKDFTVGKQGLSEQETYRLYIDLCFNQFLLNKALDAVRAKTVAR